MRLICIKLQNFLLHKAYGYSLNYSLADTMWKTFESSVIEAVISALNFIGPHLFKYYQFCEILSETESEYPNFSTTQQFDRLVVKPQCYEIRNQLQEKH